MSGKFQQRAWCSVLALKKNVLGWTMNHDWRMGTITEAPNPGNIKIRQIYLRKSISYPWRTESKQGESMVGWNKRGNHTEKWNPGWSLGRNRRAESCYRGCKVNVLGWSWVSNTEASSGYFKESKRKNRRTHQVSHREPHGMVTGGSMGGNDLKSWLLLDPQNEFASFIFPQKEGNVYGTQRVKFEVHSIACRLYSEFQIEQRFK